MVLALELQGLLLLGFLAGGGLFGLFPALVAAATVSRDDARDVSHPVWARFWSMWRAQFVSANAAGLPLGILATVAAVNLLYAAPQSIGLGIVSAVGAVLVLASLSWFGPLYAHYQLPRWRYPLVALRLVVQRPLPTMLMLLVAMAIAYLGSLSTAVWVFVGVGAWLHACTYLAVRTFDENEERLTDGPDAVSVAQILPSAPLDTR